MHDIVSPEVVGQAITSGDYIIIIIIAAMLVIYFFIQRYYDYNKHKNELVVNKELTDSLSNILSSIKDISASMSTISSFLTHFTDSIISKDREKCRIAIQLSFANLNKQLFVFSRDIIITNNIEVKRKYIDSSVDKMVNAQYYELYNYLSVFEVNNRKVINMIKEEWKVELGQIIKDIIFDSNLDATTKINTLGDKLDAAITDYTTYVHNKTFNE